MFSPEAKYLFQYSVMSPLCSAPRCLPMTVLCVHFFLALFRIFCIFFTSFFEKSICTPPPPLCNRCCLFAPSDGG